MMEELWLPVRDFPAYEVSTHGRVRSLDQRVATGNNGWRLARGRVLKGTLKKHGYLEVVLTGQVCRLVHRLVLEAFDGPCPPNMECLHGDDVRTNCHIDNLRWGTKRENADDRVTRKRSPRGLRHPRAALNEETLQWARESTQILADAAFGLDVAINTILRARKGVTYAQGGI